MWKHEALGKLVFLLLACSGFLLSCQAFRRFVFRYEVATADLSALLAISSASNVPCPLPLKFGNLRAMSVTLGFLRMFLFLIRPRKDAPPRDGKNTENKTKNSKDTEYRITHINTCPDVGFFFQRETTANSLTPDACFLCFCQGDQTAVCWKRDNRRCNTESFHYHGIGKRDKRSPGFTDIFFRDASRDIFNRNTKTQCKPYESSFSDDCPPADWCTGCTVCDCDANGRWDCHLLSFCPEDKKKSRKHNGKLPESWKPFMDKKQEKLINSSSISAPEARPNSIKKYEIPKKAVRKAKPEIQREGKKKAPPPRRIIQKRVPLKPGMKPDPGKMKTPIKYRKVEPKKNNSTKEIIIKKDIATRKPIKINKSNRVSLEMELAHKLMKKVMQSLKKTIAASVKNISEIAKQNANNVRNMKANAKLSQSKNKSKNVSKRQIKKPNMKPNCKKKMVAMKKPIYRAKGKPSRKIGAKTYIRHKRDVTMPGNIEIPVSVTHGSSAESINKTVALTVIPVTSKPVTSVSVTSVLVTSIPETSIPATSNPIVPDGSNFSDALIGISTLPDNKYYKYTVGNEEPRTKLNVSIEDTVTKQFNKTETIFNFLGAHGSSNIATEKRHVENKELIKSNYSKEINPEENGLKYSKWTNLKILKEKRITAEPIKDKRLMKLMTHTNKTIHLDDKNRSHGKKLERKINYRKKNMVKLLNHSKCRVDNCKKNNSINIHMPNKNYHDMHGYIPKILINHNKNSTTYPPRKSKPRVLKYLKRIFNKIFKGRRMPDKMSKHQLIKTLCENFGPCVKVNRKDRVLLNSKLSDLDRETTRILTTVKIIKGLLKLLVLPENVNSNFLKQEHFRNDIQKLNNILKGVYSENGQVKLTATQLTQIEYIKRSTQDFIQLVNKFASLLNQIIAILTKQDTNRFSNKTKHHFMNKNLSKDDPFQSLKNLLLRYNLVQNTFMKQIYEQLHNFEYNINEKPKVSESKDLNNSVTIENISRNIIHNLRKLKYLAQTGSYSGRERVRTKRDIGRDDDAIEYLLLLMEYLIKQNHPLDAEPVNDGIDLLIEAIKNAPDIKPIRKKVLEYTPALYSDTTTTTTSRSISATSEDTKSEDDSPSESDKTSSSEDSSKTKLDEIESKLKENKDFVVTVADDEKEFEDKLQFDRRADLDKMDEITELAFFSKLGGAEDNIVLNPENEFETTTVRSGPLEMETSDKLDSRDDLNLEKTLTIESNNLDKPIDYSEGGGKKIEVFIGDMDEETIIQSTVTIEPDIPTTMSTEFVTQAVQAQISKTKIRYQNLESVDNDSGDNRSKLKWIEENFGKETEKEFTGFEENNSTLVITPVTAKAITAKTLDKIDVIGLTRVKDEVSERADEKAKEETEKKTTAKLNAEEVMFRKQMELLNSLDYGTERAEVFESDSKDSNIEERYTGDSFPSYFV